MTTMDDWKLVAAVVPWGKNTRGKQPSDILQQDDEENIDDETWHQSVVTMNPCWMPVLHKQLIFIFQMASVIVRKNTIWLAKQNTPQTNSSLTNSHESISGNPSSTHNTLCWGTCSSGSCKDMLGGRRMNQTAQMGHEKNSSGCKHAIWLWLRHCHDTDTGRRWHHYLECLHLLAWGRHHWRLCLQLHSRHCALCLQARQDNTFSDRLLSGKWDLDLESAALILGTCLSPGIF